MTIRKETTIDARPEVVYEALSQVDGYRGWWAVNSAVADHEGGEALLHFKKDGNPVAMRFRIERLAPSSEVIWTCVANDAPPWRDTTLKWSMAPAGGSTRVVLEHDGWDGPAPQIIADGWDHFVSSLKSYVETGTGQPW